ncbi:HIRAN domain-containing protein [Propionispora vibrioides]|uniref:HIRAN domain-containing protein n=1 Tax=Propionispora vibrioides TaxID=112903 RepID=A0A1H8Y3M3_9FIRM|nr:HIRAN domain-containing protein [Propionispora vibrioides]SEP46864.1 HIRAN domain-containing protein [Propionispora vibrioides]
MLKSIAMTLSNSLVKHGLPRPQALKRAWAMAKQGQFNAKAVGVTFGLRQTALMRLKKYSKEVITILLVHEPNQYDKNAVAVKVSVNRGRAFTIGYLPKLTASLWGRLVDKQKAAAKIVKITGGNGKNLGINFKLQLVA